VISLVVAAILIAAALHGGRTASTVLVVADAAARELADAERAVARHVAPPEVVARVEAVRALRRPEDRVQQWRARQV
jgi:hypothetical protein